MTDAGESEWAVPKGRFVTEDSFFFKGNVLFRKGDYAAAAASYAASSDAFPKFAPAWANYVKCLAKLGRAGELVAVVERYMELFGGEISRIRDIQLITGNFRHCNVDEVIFRKSRIDPWIVHVLREVARVDNTNKLNRLHELFEEDPSIYITCHLIGDAYCDMSDYAEATKWYRAALCRNPDYGWSWFNLAKALIACAGEFSERVCTLERTAELMNGSMYEGEVLRLLADHLACTRFIRRAAQLYIDVARMEPDSDSILFGIETLLKIGDFAGARALAAHLKIWPNRQHHAWAAEFLDWAERSC